MLKDYFLYSLRTLKNRGIRSWLTMIGIFIGIAAIVSLIGLGEGLRFAITSQFGFLGPDVLSVQASGIGFAGPPGTAVPNPLTEDLAKKISKISNIETAFNRYIQSAPIEFNGHQDIGFTATVPEGENRKIFETMVNLKAEEGRLLKEGDGRRVTVGNDFKKKERFGKSVHVGDKILINGISFEVVGILEKKGSFIFDSSILMNEETLLKDLKKDKNNVNVIAIKVKNKEEINGVKHDVEKLLRKERSVKKGEEDFSVQSPQATLEALNSTLFAVQLFVYIIASISLLVGGIGIMNTMYTAVLERTKEIGIMKSIGAKNSTIFTIFFMESGLLGSAGGLVGIIFGLFLAYSFAAAGRLLLGSGLIQAKIGFGLIIGALVFSFVIGLIAGTLPAYQASKKQPVDALRFVK